MKPEKWDIVPAAAARLPALAKIPMPRIPFDPMPLLEAFVDWRKSAGEQKTIRRQIEIEGRVRLERIRMECRLLDKYLKETFDERRMVLDKLLSVLDRALAEKDTRCLEIAVTGIVEVSRSNPIPSLQAFTAARAKGEVLEI